MSKWHVTVTLYESNQKILQISKHEVWVLWQGRQVGQNTDFHVGNIMVLAKTTHTAWEFRLRPLFIPPPYQKQMLWLGSLEKMFSHTGGWLFAKYLKMPLWYMISPNAISSWNKKCWWTLTVLEVRSSRFLSAKSVLIYEFFIFIFWVSQLSGVWPIIDSHIWGEEPANTQTELIHARRDEFIHARGKLAYAKRRGRPRSSSGPPCENRRYVTVLVKLYF